jgi:rSAM/selenodomain-associated transferase 1
VSQDSSRAGLAVIVITFNEGDQIEEVLQRVTETSGLKSLEVVVVDGGSTDRTVELAGRYAEVVISPPGRARQMNRGLQVVSGEAVLFCHGDTLLPPGYGKQILQACLDQGAAGGSFRPKYDPPHPVLAAVSRVLRISSPYLTFGDQAMFARWDSLLAVGGVPAVPQMEDVALALALSRQGKLVKLPGEVITSSRRFLERGVLRQLFHDFKILIGYHLGQLDPAGAAASYQVTSRDLEAKWAASWGAVGVMAKAPLPGHAKTRLAASLGEERAAEIYGEILGNLLDQLREVGDELVSVVFTPEEEDRKWFWKNYPGWEVRLQSGANLGEKLCTASLDLFETGADRVFLIAADTPELSAAVLREASRLLEATDLVLGPSPDGGYYLIGMDRPRNQIFEGISWSSPGVLEETLAAADRMDLQVGLLEPLADIDTGEDWQRYQLDR